MVILKMQNLKNNFLFILLFLHCRLKYKLKYNIINYKKDIYKWKKKVQSKIK